MSCLIRLAAYRYSEEIFKLTNRPAMALFSHGNDFNPSSAGRVFITYNKDKKPGTSIVIQASFPGMLKRFVVEVLPAGYQSVAH